MTCVTELSKRDVKVKMSACSRRHDCARPSSSPRCDRWSPSGPGFAQALGIFRVDSQDGPRSEAALQQVHRVEPDALKGLPVHRVAWLLGVHLCLRAAADLLDILIRFSEISVHSIHVEAQCRALRQCECWWWLLLCRRSRTAALLQLSCPQRAGSWCLRLDHKAQFCCSTIACFSACLLS